MVHDWRHQPFRALYLVYHFASTFFVFLPYYVIKYAPRSWRPRQSWTLGRSLMIALLRRVFTTEHKVALVFSFPTHEAIKEGPGVKALWIKPTPELMNEQLQQWAAISGVHSARIPGYWMDKEGLDIPMGAPLQPGEKILYRLHGGAFTWFSSHPHDYSAVVPRDLLRNCPSFRRSFSIEYRLSEGSPYPARNPFPAALLDTLAGYSYLVNECHYRPSDIVVIGESAGGNLALGLIRYLVEQHGNPLNNVPAPPAGLILYSPWVDLSASHVKPGSSALLNVESDFVGHLTGVENYSTVAFLGPHGQDGAETNMYISPASLRIEPKFCGFPRTFIIAGGAEAFLDQIKTLKNRMVRDMGEGSGTGQVTYHEAPDSVHSFISMESHEPERTNAYQKIAEWMDMF